MDENSTTNEKPKMEFNFGALKEIKEATEVDLMNPDGKVNIDNLTPDNFQRIAQAGIKWGNRGMSDEDAQKESDYITLKEVVTALQDSFGTKPEDVNQEEHPITALNE